jgi:hypothetical protein
MHTPVVRLLLNCAMGSYRSHYSGIEKLESSRRDWNLTKRTYDRFISGSTRLINLNRNEQRHVDLA